MKNLLIALSVLLCAIAPSAHAKNNHRQTNVTIVYASDSTTDSQIAIDTIALPDHTQNNEFNIDNFGNSFNSPNNTRIITNTIIAISSVLILTAGSIGLVWLLLYYRRRQHLDKLNIVSKSLDLDRPLPKEFFHTGYRPTIRKFTRGICWIGAGLAVILFFSILGTPIWPLGVLLLFIGASQVAGYFIATRDSVDK